MNRFTRFDPIELIGIQIGYHAAVTPSSIQTGQQPAPSTPDRRVSPDHLAEAAADCTAEGAARTEGGGGETGNNRWSVPPQS